MPAGSAPSSQSPGSGAATGSRVETVSPGREQYIISAKPPAMLQPLAAGFAPESLEQALVSDARVQHLRTIRLAGGVRALSADPFAPQDVHVVRLRREDAADVSRQIGHLAFIERDELLHVANGGTPTVGVVVPGLGVAAATGTTLRVTIAVSGKEGKSLEGAQVVVFGGQSSTQGVTDRAGEVLLTLPGETGDTIRGIVVTARANYWSAWIPSPHLDASARNTVALTPIEEFFPEFPRRELAGWGIEAMNVRQLPPALQGQGVSIGVVDTGIAARTHQNLRGQVEGGYNIVQQNPTTWDQDSEGHGTHCAGIIAALADGKGIRGIAPAARLRSYTVFPGGRFSDLIDALNHCMLDNVDIVNLGVVADVTSDQVEQKIRQAREQGIVCIVAAGNSAGAVAFPATSPNVLAVAAVGKLGTFPPTSWQSTEANSGDGVAVSSDGYFSPVFSCYGPAISVCAPGVAVISCFPPNDYAVMDGTSIAAAHVTGLAALLLAHHPDFQGPYRERDARRVDRLFELLMQGARPLPLGAAAASVPRTGAGLVDAAQSLNLVPAHPAGQVAVSPSPTFTPAKWAEFVRTYLPDTASPVRFGELEGSSVRPASALPT
jgi:hypothetical protein